MSAIGTVHHGNEPTALPNFLLFFKRVETRFYNIFRGYASF